MAITKEKASPVPTKNSEGSFVKGRDQVVKMLRYMDKEERQIIINRMKLKNPALADELMSESFSFDEILDLNSTEIRFIGKQVPNNLWVLALKYSTPQVQRHILKSLEREKAEEIFHKVRLDFIPGIEESNKAKERIIDLAVNLLRKKKTHLQ